MKICTYNVNSIKARKDLILEWLEHRKNDIDVLCFQELKTVDEGFPFRDFETLGFERFVFGQKAYNGVGICTKKPAKNIHQDIDVYSPENLADSIGTMSEERKTFEALLAWGLFDAVRKLHPQTRQFTRWDYIGGAIWKDKGMRIDYGLCAQVLVHKIKGMEVDIWPRKRRKPTPSDHAPLIADIEV